MPNIIQDIRYALRTLARSRGFAAAAMLAMALGIGANTAIFSVVYAVLLRSLPFGDPSRIVQVWHTPPQRSFPGVSLFPVSPANYLDWLTRNHVFDRMAISSHARFNLTGSGEPQAIDTEAVSSDFFPVLQSRPEIGRTFVPDEEHLGRNHVVVLSHAFWREHFNDDPGIVGRTIQLNGEAYTVIGVMRDAFRFPATAKVWTALALSDQDRAVRGEHNFTVIARLNPGVSLQQAQAEMDTVSGQLAEQYPEDDAGWGAKVISLREGLVGDVRPALLVLLGAVVFVLLIACANVANLVLARTLTRHKEIAIRKALGASQGRVVRQVVSESILLAIGGGALGLLIAHFGIRLIVLFLAGQIPRSEEIGLSPAVLLFTLGASVITGVLAGLAPAWTLARTNMNDALKQGLGRTDSDGGHGRARKLLVVAEVALSLILLIGSGLMIRSLSHLRSTDPGFQTTHAFTLTPSVSRATFNNAMQEEAFYRDSLQRIRTLPGVAAAGAIDSLPLSGGSMQPIAIEGRPPVAMADQPEVAVRVITPGYLGAMHIPVVQGRDIGDSDTHDRPPVVLISASMAKRFWPDGKPLGRHLTLSFFSGPPREIVGVIGDVKQNSLYEPGDPPTLYAPVEQLTPSLVGSWRRTRYRWWCAPASFRRAPSGRPWERSTR